MTTLATRTASSTTGTRTLLACLAVAGPLWAAVALAQAATRAGFDLTRHPLSALSNGTLGWLQIANFMIAGALTLAGAVGLHRALARGWLPRLVAAYGVGMLAAGLLVMDPADGFPIGTPYGMPSSMSWHSYGHMAAGTLAFTAAIAACYVLAHRFTRAGNPRAATASIIAGTALLAGNLWAMSGGTAGTLTLAVGAITASLWISAVAATLAINSR
ncbi:DUF998 domain-containing protein [Amorphoplanes digitatis]|uniref:DUF998 domain-containing protein n=1 Tax=Actinoplanes digitatis TaxID=1868 RepID=A0A7W7MTI1_9ACTN|nr:DUF998 domain-containing protein [Actinoplanes digitatis]MBB4765604.1 hypothetical protein [Actinoplanes digitatis]BFE75467.1 hypothetical protein GCM10020092_087680 [Actinoplanes digitatis]GID93505.1 hypothetical protein Adi01nite_29170 [Actinoplanes digitatis]